MNAELLKAMLDSVNNEALVAQIASLVAVVCAIVSMVVAGAALRLAARR